MSMRRLKREIQRQLARSDFKAVIPYFEALPGRKAVNPLLSLLLHPDERIRWHAVSAFGLVTTALADSDMESARIVMRRLMWHLNDESGGIGWGVPEAMGESLARHPGLAEEYSKILVSYILPGGNFLEHEALQCGVLWGLRRLAGIRPNHLAGSGSGLMPFLRSAVALQRGLAASLIGCIRHQEAMVPLQDLAADFSAVRIYCRYEIRRQTVAELASSALQKMDGAG